MKTTLYKIYKKYGNYLPRYVIESMYDNQPYDGDITVVTGRITHTLCFSGGELTAIHQTRDIQPIYTIGGTLIDYM